MKNILKLVLCVVALLWLQAATPASAGVAWTGDVVIYWTDFGEFPVLDVGNAGGSATLNITSGSEVTNLLLLTNVYNANGNGAFGYGSPQYGGYLMESFGLTVGIDLYDYGNTTSGNNSVLVDGTNSILECSTGPLYIGGSFNSIKVSGGATFSCNYMENSGSNSTFLVTDPGTTFEGGVNLNANDSFIVKNGAQYNSNSQYTISSIGSSNIVMITGTNTTVNGNVSFSASTNCNLTINNGAKINGYEIGASGGNNTIIVDGLGTIVTTGGGFSLTGVSNQLIISGGSQINLLPYGLSIGSGSSATITDSGTGVVGGPGLFEDGGLLTISNGAQVNWSGLASMDPGSVVLVTGLSSSLSVTNTGSWSGVSNTISINGQLIAAAGGSVAAGTIYVGGINPGYYGYGAASLNIAFGGAVAASSVIIQSSSSIMVAGNLMATNSTGSGRLVLSGPGASLNVTGTVVADTVSLEGPYYNFNCGCYPTGPGGPFAFPSGTLMAKGLGGNNNQTFVVGDGTNTANYVMQGGTHSFVNGLVISSNSLLSGCGTVTGSVTNYGTILLGGCDITFSNAVVNFGTIIATNGLPHFLSTFSNQGAFVTNPPVLQTTAQNFKVVYSFTYPESQSAGDPPTGDLVFSGNTFYGTTMEGGNQGGFGTVFAINAGGTGSTILHSFSGAYYPGYNNSDGAFPQAGVILSGNTLYGTTWAGGTSGLGTVFSVNTDGTGFTNLHSFTGSDGAAPQAGLVVSGNTLYGMTHGVAFNGSQYGGDTVFAVNTDGTGFTNLYTFTDTGNGASGAGPFAGLTLSSNRLYGATYSSGTGTYSSASSGYGRIFAINTDGTGFTSLHSFTPRSDSGSTNSDGAYPRGRLVLSGNTLYGTASLGGTADNGTIFAINTDGTGFTNLHNFTQNANNYYGTNNDGAYPQAGLILLGNTLYGTAQSGGTGGEGTVFAINTDGTGFTTLHNFTFPSAESNYTTNSDGGTPEAGLTLSGNVLYGTTPSFGPLRGGTLFSLSLPPPPLAITFSGKNTVLTWPTYAPGVTLQSTTNLTPPIVWITNLPSPVVVNGQNTITNAMSGTQKFYRLSQ